jgi:hypothetical protein
MIAQKEDRLHKRGEAFVDPSQNHLAEESKSRNRTPTPGKRAPTTDRFWPIPLKYSIVGRVPLRVIAEIAGLGNGCRLSRKQIRARCCFMRLSARHPVP